MKKIWLIMICAVLCLSGCQKDTFVNSTAGQETPPLGGDLTESPQDDQSQTVGENTGAGGVNLGQIGRFFGLDVYVNAPNGYFPIECGLTGLYLVEGKRYVAVTSAGFDKASSLSEAHEMAFELLKGNIENYSIITDLNTASEENVTVNGTEAYRFEGTFTCKAPDGSDYNAYAVGYSFLIDNVPCSIVGSVIDMEQSADAISEIKGIVDSMIQTVHREE